MNGTSPVAHKYLESLRSFGATPVFPDGLAEHGYTPMHLSPEIDRDATEALVARSRNSS